MASIYFVLAIGADQQNVSHIRATDEAPKEVQRGRICPLQIVEEDDKWMFLVGNGADEFLKHELETVSRLARPK